jgi:hypothetical protein
LEENGSIVISHPEVAVSLGVAEEGVIEGRDGETNDRCGQVYLKDNAILPCSQGKVIVEVPWDDADQYQRYKGWDEMGENVDCFVVEVCQTPKTEPNGVVDWAVPRVD